MRRRHGRLPHAPLGVPALLPLPLTADLRGPASRSTATEGLQTLGGYTERASDPDILSPCSLTGRPCCLWHTETWTRNQLNLCFR
jgi:hypothetical protein